MTDMPVASGMDMMEESGAPEPFAIGQAATSNAGDTIMAATSVAPIDEPCFADWDNGSSLAYPMNTDIGTSAPVGPSVSGTGEAAKGTPATASGGSL